MLSIATVNVNGVRAAHRKGMTEWIAERDPDILATQEVRAPNEIAFDLLSAPGYHVASADAEAKGRSGVAIASKPAMLETRIGIGDEYFDRAGRWIESDFAIGSKTLTLASAYVNSGEAGTEKQDDKYRFLDAMTTRLKELRDAADYALVVGDLNVGHTKLDIKNWKGNTKKAGFLPEERAYFDKFFDTFGWVDIARAHAGEVDGPYTWWSMRGKAFDNDTGWRIDYQMATPKLAELARTVNVDRAPSYADRWSDHAPLIVEYDL